MISFSLCKNDNKKTQKTLPVIFFDRKLVKFSLKAIYLKKFSLQNRSSVLFIKLRKKFHREEKIFFELNYEILFIQL